MKVALLAGAQFLDQLVVHDHLGDAAIGQAAHEAGAADVGIVDLEAEAGRQQHAERRHHAHQPALGVGGLEHDHGQADIGAVLGGHALDQRALLALGAGRRVAADLPVFVHRLDRALGSGRSSSRARHQARPAAPAAPSHAQRRSAHLCRARKCPSFNPLACGGAAPGRLPAGESPPVSCILFVSLGHARPPVKQGAAAGIARRGPSKTPSRGVNTAFERAWRASPFVACAAIKVHCGRHGIVV